MIVGILRWGRGGCCQQEYIFLIRHLLILIVNERIDPRDEIL
jgi:hypothetical protein